MASPIADFVVSLRDGHIVNQGSVSDVLKQDQLLSEEFKHDEAALELDEAEEAAAGGESTEEPREGKLVVTEEVAVGHVSWAACAFLFPLSLPLP